VKNWLNKLIDRLRRNRTGLVLLKLSLSYETERGLPLSGGTSIPTCPLCGVVPLNWDVHNKWCPVVVGTKRTEKLLVGVNGGAEKIAVDRETYPAHDCVDRPTSKERFEPETWRLPPESQPIEGKTCRSCGGQLVLIRLYNCEPWTDVITPAGTAEKCLRCGRVTEHFTWETR
jgi:hypothetical protein